MVAIASKQALLLFISGSKDPGGLKQKLKTLLAGGDRKVTLEGYELLLLLLLFLL